MFLSQAISVAFYIIAFAEAFDPVLNWLNESYGINITDKRVVSIPAMAILTLLLLLKGANLGMKALYLVVSVLALSLISFFLGSPTDAMSSGLF